MYHFAFNKIPVELSSQLYILVSQTLSPVSLGQPLNRSGQFQLSKWLPFTACRKSIATETDTERAGPRALGQGDRVEIMWNVLSDRNTVQLENDTISNSIKQKYYRCRK